MAYVTLRDLHYDLDTCNRKLAILADVDGTLCDVSRITWLVSGPKKDFDRFHETSANCPPHEEPVRILRQARKDPMVAIIVVTGRQAKFDYLTRSWLVENEVPFDFLMMRPNGDFCKDTVLKKRMLTQVREAGFYVFGTLDDNPGVIEEVWEAEKIPMIHRVPGWDERNNINGTAN